MLASAPADVLDFWFGAPPRATAARAEWFRKNEAFDALIRERFGALVEQALAELRTEFPGLQPASENKGGNLRYLSFDAGRQFSALALTSYQGHYCRIRLTLAQSAIGQDFQCLMDSLSAMLSHFSRKA